LLLELLELLFELPLDLLLELEEEIDAEPELLEEELLELLVEDWLLLETLILEAISEMLTFALNLKSALK
jgi:hypothetical protein